MKAFLMSSVMLTALAYGATAEARCASYTAASGSLIENGKVEGYKIRRTNTSNLYFASAKVDGVNSTCVSIQIMNDGGGGGFDLAQGQNQSFINAASMAMTLNYDFELSMSGGSFWPATPNYYHVSKP